MSAPAPSGSQTIPLPPPHSLDLDAYLARLGYHGPRAATTAVLRAVHAAHARTIPYENLDVLLGRLIRTDLASIERKLVHERRGGYCFEQNYLLAAALRSLGFRVTQCISRVRWQVPLDVVTPPTHLVLLVEGDDGRMLADVGFGSMSLIEPLAFALDREQAVAVEPRRIVALPRDGAAIRSGGLAYAHQARLGDTWHDVYYFSADEVPAIDIEVANWFTCTHPQSRFKLNLTLARAGEGCRYTIFNREFTIRYADGRAEKHEIRSPEELLDLLAVRFGVVLPPGTRFGPPGSPWPS
ncbi:MAG: arylamine N-acetyltransferase [Verrucomicrobia bacterium]|nr:arylamine N-acetyltransferase [Verrucomicrobiota bacterium]